MDTKLITPINKYLKFNLSLYLSTKYQVLHSSVSLKPAKDLALIYIIRLIRNYCSKQKKVQKGAKYQQK